MGLALLCSGCQGQLCSTALVRGRASSQECGSWQGVRLTFQYTHHQGQFCHTVLLLSCPPWLAHLCPCHCGQRCCVAQVRVKPTLPRAAAGKGQRQLSCIHHASRGRAGSLVPTLLLKLRVSMGWGPALLPMVTIGGWINSQI